MRQGTGYAYGDGEAEWIISYKCEGCGQRVRVTPDQAQHFRGALTACSRVCVLKAHERRTRQRRLAMGMPEHAEGTALGPEVGAAPARQGAHDTAGGLVTPPQPAHGNAGD
jgi:hypothetical protein